MSVRRGVSNINVTDRLRQLLVLAIILLIGLGVSMIVKGQQNKENSSGHVEHALPAGIK